MDKFKVAVRCDFGTFTTDVDAADEAEALNIAETRFTDRFGPSTISSKVIPTML